MTRTITRWKTKPWNLEALWDPEEVAGAWGLPILEPEDVKPKRLVAFDTRLPEVGPEREAAVHFFIDDYRFESVWTNPQRSLPHLQRIGTVLTPDFSLWYGSAHARQLWQVYRSRWLGAYWQGIGIRVVPTLQWSDRRSLDYVLDGLPQGSTLAVSQQGASRDAEARKRFGEGLMVAMRQLRPLRLLVYGPHTEPMPRPSWGCNPEIVEYRAWSQDRFPKTPDPEKRPPEHKKRPPEGEVPSGESATVDAPPGPESQRGVGTPAPAGRSGR